jgi:hypothetical protein
VQLVVDPVWLSPPKDASGAEWLKKIEPLRELISAGSVKVSCPKDLRDQMIARWFEDGSHIELIRTLNELEGRLASTVKLDEGEAIFESVRASPGYIWEGLDVNQRETFTEHLAEAALADDDGQTHFGVLSPMESWSEAKSELLVEAEVLQRETSEGDLREPGEAEATLRSFLPRSESINTFFSTCSTKVCALAGDPEFGVKAYFIGALNGDPSDLQFEVGSEFVASVRSLGIDRIASNARTLLRTMALIASGKADQIEGHEERVSAGAGSKTLCQGECPVIRSYVNNHTPNAMRLFWVRKERPLFLNVTGHEGFPALK